MEPRLQLTRRKRGQGSLRSHLTQIRGHLAQMRREAANRGGLHDEGCAGRACRARQPPRNTEISDLYVRPLQVWRYLRQFPSPCSPNWSLLRQADLNSLQTSLRAGRWQVSRYLRQFPSPCSPSLSLFSQARRNSSHCPPTRTPPGPISIDWEKAEIGITKRAAAAAAPSANFRIPFNISSSPAAGELPVRIHHAGSRISFRPKWTKVNLRSCAGTAYDQLCTVVASRDLSAGLTCRERGQGLASTAP
jgi:hypothetical protein